jgi:toxin ParE1/3/4
LGEVRLSQLAQRDLQEIWFHIASDNGPAAADHWIDRIERGAANCRNFRNPDRPVRTLPMTRECW